MDEAEQYARYVASGKNGKLYIGIGSARRDLVVYDPATQIKKSLLAGGDRTAGWVKVEEGDDGEIYASFVDGRKYRVEDERLVPVRSIPEKALRLQNGGLVRRVFNGTESGHLVVSNGISRLERQVDFRYRGAGAEIFMVGAGPGGKVYGSTAQTLEVFSYDPEDGASIHLGGMPGGEVYSMLPFGKRLYMCYYGGAVMTLYDPGNPRWHFGRGTNDNPVSYGPLGPGHLRPRAMVQGPDNKIIIGSLPDYGQHTGGLAIWGPQENRLIANIRPVVTNQSILSLAYEPVSGLIFGGTGNYGGGTTPLAQEAVVFAFDPERRVKLYDLPLVSGAQAYRAMAAARGLVFAVSDKISVFDPRARKVVAELKLPDGRPLDVSLGVHSNGKIYGLTSKVLFEVDPEKLSMVELGRPPDGIDRGFALVNSGVYFARGSRLWRYRW